MKVKLREEITTTEDVKKTYYIIDFIEGIKTLSFGVHEDDSAKNLKEKLESLLKVFDYASK